MRSLRYYLLTATLSLAAGIATAQTTQRGYVYEYNDDNQKIPLSNVEIVVANAGSTVSDENGAFTLRFRQLRPGDRVIVRRITKPGYGIFNQDAIEQWYISEGDVPFSVVLCRTEKLLKDRNKMEALASQKVAAVFEQDQKTLQISRENGEVSQEDYKKKLHKLQMEYEDKLNNIDNYIDRFIRIDMTTLSENEQKIIELIKVGDFDEAIALYEEEDLLKKFELQHKNVQRLQNASSKYKQKIQELQAERLKIRQVVFRQVDLLRMQGGKEAFNKIMDVLRKFAAADSGDYYNQLVYARHLYNMTDYKEALKVYEGMRHTAETRRDSMNLLKAECYSAITRQVMGQLTVGISAAEHSLPLFEDYRHLQSDTLSPLRDQAFFCQSMGVRYAMLNRYDDAHDAFERGLSAMHSLRRETKLRDLESQYAMYLVQYGTYMRKTKWKSRSIELLREAISVLETLYAQKPYYYEARLAFAYSNLGLVYFSQGVAYYEDAESAFLEGEIHYRKSVERNPDGYARFLASNLNNLGECYMAMGEYDRGILCFEEAAQIWLNEPNGALKYANQLSIVYYNLGHCCYNLQDLPNALKYDLISLDEMEPLYAAEPDIYREKMATRLLHLCNTYMAMEDYERAYIFAKRAFEVDPSYAENKAKYMQLKDMLGK